MTRERAGAGPSQRQLRVGEQMRHLLASHLMRGDLHSRHLDEVSVTVSEVRMSRDLRQAQVFVAELGRDAQPATLEALAKVGPALSGRLAREMNLKYAPRLRFEPDTSFSYAARIESLLEAERRVHGDGDAPAAIDAPEPDEAGPDEAGPGEGRPGEGNR